jgi:hypothetical protein
MDPDGRPGGQVRPDRGCRKEEDLGLFLEDQTADDPGVGKGEIFLQGGVIGTEHPVRTVAEKVLGEVSDSMPQKEGHDFHPSPLQGKLLRRGQQLKGHLGHTAIFLLNENPDALPIRCPTNWHKIGLTFIE